MKHKDKIVINIMIPALLVLVIYPSIQWFRNPHLTSMEIFIKYIWHYLGALIVALIGMKILTKEMFEKKKDKK